MGRPAARGRTNIRNSVLVFPSLPQYIYGYDALDNRYGFSISVQPEIDCTTFHSFFS